MENDLEFIKRIAVNADRDYTLRKAAEECLELATVLLQQVNKPSKNYTKNIEEEISHVSMRMLMISELFDKNNIQREFNSKIGYLRNWETERGYKNL